MFDMNVSLTKFILFKYLKIIEYWQTWTFIGKFNFKHNNDIKNKKKQVRASLTTMESCFYNIIFFTYVINIIFWRVKLQWIQLKVHKHQGKIGLSKSWILRLDVAYTIIIYDILLDEWMVQFLFVPKTLIFYSNFIILIHELI